MVYGMITVLDYNSYASGGYGKIRADLEKKGTPIGPMDMLIAGLISDESDRGYFPGHYFKQETSHGKDGI